MPNKLKRPKTKAGDRFGSWLVLDDPVTCKNTKVRCQCGCGAIRAVSLGNLRSGKSTSCGCESVKAIIARSTKHGGCGTSEYNIWASMIQRCTNPRSRAYRYYGARGITVSQEWKTFNNFMRDMGARPGLEYSIERVKNNEGYCAENCVWGTDSEQSRNQRSNRHITYNGRTQIISDWAREYGLNLTTLICRLKRWKDFSRSIETPVS